MPSVSDIPENVEERLAILRDAKEQIVAKHFLPGPGYGVVYAPDYGKVKGISDYKAALEEGRIVCSGCIRAALFIGACIAGVCEISRGLKSVGLACDPTIKIFGEDACLAEEAYEVRHGFASDSTSTEACERAMNFGMAYPDKTDRALAILDNMLANQGRFVP